MPKSYDSTSVERRWYTQWEEKGFFAPTGDPDLPAYCIMIPPPNVTGSLHMGHAFQDTIMDALIRRRRMQGQRVLWQTGTDHAGIATQMLVERQLEATGKSRHDLGREAFLERVWSWKAHSGDTIVRQLRRLGASCDWSRERFTMDPALSHAVREAFVRLYNEGLIYRGKRLVNWDPVLQTAVSDLEVISEEEKGFLWHLRYPLANGEGFVVVATTRPETMLGDVAVAVHPEDERYAHWVGSEVVLPLTGRRIPVIADSYVDPKFGTGCVKITPAHDFNDYEMGQRHGLPLINILTPDAHIHEQAPEAYRGLDRFEARKRIVEDLERQGLLAKVEDHRLMIPRGDRSRAVLEPFLTDQWFVKVAPLAKEAICAVEDGRIRFIPGNWDKTYFEWMRNIQDWCISRQIWWGHRIPVWYGPDGHLFVCNCEEQVYEMAAEHYGYYVDLIQDPDVLDTWFSSALWPFATLGWPKVTPDLHTYYPTDVLVTGFDIIFFWVARMIMMGLKFTGQVPFRHVYITGLVRDGEGNKMSKSKGNILDPLDLIDGIDLETLVSKRTREMMQPHLAKKIEAATRKEFPQGITPVGTDALRFTMASLATQGRDVKFDMGRVEGYRNFCNKLWNAARFVLMNVEGHGAVGGDDAQESMFLPDRWIRSRLQRVVVAMDGAFERYRFDEAALVIYHFLWGEFCDWYLELVKPVLYDDALAETEKSATRRVMVETLETALRLLHPLMPFITEELWQKVAPLAMRGGETIMRASWPQSQPGSEDETAEAEADFVMRLVTLIRTVRAEMNVPPAKRLPLVVVGEAMLIESLRRHEKLIMAMARLESWQVVEGVVPEGAATGVMPGLQVFIPLAGVIDLEVEEVRLEKALQQLEADLARVTNKLANAGFLAKAKEEVVALERAKESDLKEKRPGLVEALARIHAARRLT
ncbi:MAG: valine--tRNA ligase [Magnetococcales bacterium]|nr:valine--tRNA ligase [Magnetococcales bacterium]MBF0438834.1 valine--tRNA ligase [Magnetococcales bacterium]